MTVQQTLAEAAVAHAEALREYDAADAEVERLRPAMDAAKSRRAEADRALTQIESAMATVRLADRTRRALIDITHRYEGPLWISVPAHRAKVFFLVAVGSDGTGLYQFTPQRSHRYQGKEWAIRVDQAEASGIQSPRTSGRLGDASPPLCAWEGRGSGNFGAGSGAMRPLAPPEGGKWRWLKVDAQPELTAGTSEAS